MGLFDSNAGSSELYKAVAALEAVGVPNASQLSLPELQKYVVAGVLSPQQYQAISMDPDTYKNVASQADQSGTSAQKAALQQLGGIVQAGGSTPINQANLVNNIDQTNQAMKGARGAIMQNAQERGVSGGGLDFVNQLMNEQNNSANANSNAVNSAANNAQLALQALSSQGSLGGTLQSQSNQDAQAKAQAAQQIAEYNSQLQSSANQYNTQMVNQAEAANLGQKQATSDANAGNANYRTEYNANVPQTVFQDQMQKANGVSGAYANQSGLDQKQAQQNSAFAGNMIGTGATLAGAYFGGPVGAAAGKAAASQLTGKNPNTGFAHGGEVMCYAQGGEVHDHSLCTAAGGDAPVDSEANDTVPAMLSPNEIVLPRSVSMSPDAPQKAEQFVQGIKGNQMGIAPKVSSFAEALRILEENGLELRLSSHGDSNGR